MQRPSDNWTDEQLESWVGPRAFAHARKLVARTPPHLERDDPDYVVGVFEEKGHFFKCMLAPGVEPERSRLSCECPDAEEGPCRHAAALVLFLRGPKRGDPAADPLQAVLAKMQATTLQAATERALGFKLQFAADEPLVVEACRVRPGTKHAEVLPTASVLDHPPPFADAHARIALEALAPYASARRFVVPAEAAGHVVAELHAALCYVRDPSEPLTWHDEPVELRFATKDLMAGIGVTGEARSREGHVIAVGTRARVLQAGHGAWLFDGKQTMHRLNIESPAPLLESLFPGPYFVTPKDLERWASELLPQLRQWGGVELGDTRTPKIVETEPTPAILLDETETGLRIAPRFRYKPSTVLVEVDKGSTVVDGGTWYLRDSAEETNALKMLKALLITEPRDGEGRWFLPTERALLFLDAELPKLTGAGWEVYGEEDLKRIKIVPGELVPSVRVDSGLDWFDVNFEFQFAGKTFDGWQLLAEWDRNRRFIPIDGGYIKLPAELLKKLRERLAELPEGGRLRRSQAGIIASLLGEVPTATIDTGWRETARALETLQHPASITPHPELQAELRPYQQAGLDWLVFLHRNRFGGILADDMGLGKTLQTIAFLLTTRGNGPALVVCPSSVVFNWEREVAKFAPSLKAVRWTGEARAEKAEQIDGADVVVTNYAILRRDIPMLAQRRWRAVILDEAQAIKNAGSQTAEAARALQADFKLALSGTPLENHLGELWSYFEFVMPGFFGSAKGFQERTVRVIDQPAVRDKLRKRVAPFILRRMKQDVAKDLPPKTEVLLECEFGEAQRNAYESIRAAYKMSLFDKIEKEGLAKSRIHVLEALLRLRQACCDPRLLPYDHTRDIQESAKLEALLELVGEVAEEDHKMIVFSQFTSMLDILEKSIGDLGVMVTRLDGTTADREAPVKRFQEDPACKVILVSLKAGGAGLNLTAADYVVHYDPWWNPAVEDQATDRAYRIGQTRPVFVYKLVAKETVEEKMLDLQSKKRGLIDGVLGEGGAEALLTVEDLKEIFADG